MHLELIHSIHGYTLLTLGIAGIVAGVRANGFFTPGRQWRRLPASLVWMVGIFSLALLIAVLFPAVHPVFILLVAFLLTIVCPQVVAADDDPERSVDE